MALLDTITAILDDSDAAMALMASRPMLPSEIEAAVMNLRARIQAAIDALRSAYGFDAEPLAAPLADLAASLLAYGRALIETKPPLKQITLDSGCTVAELAWSLYKDMSRTSEIVLLNAIANPNRLSAGTVLRVYVQ
jgi:prophage DNA circulation protein